MIGWASMHRFLVNDTDQYDLDLRPKWSIEELMVTKTWVHIENKNRDTKLVIVRNFIFLVYLLLNWYSWWMKVVKKYAFTYEVKNIRRGLPPFLDDPLLELLDQALLLPTASDFFRSWELIAPSTRDLFTKTLKLGLRTGDCVIFLFHTIFWFIGRNIIGRIPESKQKAVAVLRSRISGNVSVEPGIKYSLGNWNSGLRMELSNSLR